MKSIKRIIMCMTVCFLMILVSVPCYAQNNINIIKKHNVTMVPNTKMFIHAKNQKNIKWKSSNTKVATIKKYNSNTVTVSAIKTGTTTITASTGGKTYKCKIKVQKLKKAYFSFEDKNDLDYESLADKIMIVGGYEFFNIMTTPKATYSEQLSVKELKSSNPKVLSVKQTQGAIYMSAKKTGKATISAKIGNKKLKYTITVQKPKIQLSCADNIELNVGQSLTVNVDSNINIIAIDQVGSSVSLKTKEEGNLHSIDGKYQFTLTGISSGVSKIKIYDNATPTDNPCQKILTVTVSDNPIANIKKIIQASGYQNSMNEKYIGFQMNDNGVVVTFAIFDIYPDDRLLFYTNMDYGTQYIVCEMDVSSQDVGVTPIILMSRGDSAFITEYSILKRNLTTRNNLYFTIKERTGIFSSSSLSSNIQSLSNSALNASLTGWNYLLTQQCDCSLSTLGFTSIK